MCPSILTGMEKLYEQLAADASLARVVSEENSQDGSEDSDTAGARSSPLLSAMVNTVRLTEQVILSWEESGKAPEISDLRMWFKSLDVSPEENICTLWLVVNALCFGLLIKNGDDDMVSAMLSSINKTTEQKNTAASTSSNQPPVSGNGESTEAPAPRRKKRAKRSNPRKGSRETKRAKMLRLANARASQGIEEYDEEYTQKLTGNEPKKDHNKA